MQVEFKFAPGQKVSTPTDAEGVITNASIGKKPGNDYYVATPGGGGSWWSEEDLTALN